MANVGDLANIAQLTGLDAVRLIGLIVKAAATARMHKSNCRRFAQHLKLIGGLLEQLRVSELKKYPETREPLEQLEDALRRGYLLVNSCQDRSYLYLLAMGWNIVYRFRTAQTEIDNYLRLVPLITLVDNARVRERIEYIERDQCEYSLDEEDKEVQEALLNPDPSTNPSIVLKKTLSCSYPNLPFNEALRKESEKLQVELQRSQSNMDMAQCEVIHHLLGVTRTVESSIPDESTDAKVTKKTKSKCTKVNEDSAKSYDDDSPKKQKDAYVAPRMLLFLTLLQIMPLMCEKQYGRRSEDLLFSMWNVLKNCFNRQEQAHVLYVVQLKYPKHLIFVNGGIIFSLSSTSVEGGCCDDFLSHVMCCCCALVQEWREVEIRGAYGGKTKITPPAHQYMEH
uniref:MCAfunc domain-containing protein n=1 Tax=Aegilops tauschii TaxID=37682 RepID=M8BKQ0_AEGTA